jgi:cyanophycinase
MKPWRFVLLTLMIAASALDAGPRIHFSGSPADREVIPEPGLLLMGGGGDVDAAMGWFLRKARGGDVVVLRASGGDGYHDYFMQELGVGLNSVRSLVYTGRGEADDERALEHLRRAEAVFIAGGDQAKYIRFWKDTPVEAVLNAHVAAGKPLGGTSAGLAVMGSVAYAALHDGDLTSELALRQPGHHWITLETDFLEIPTMVGILTDSHFTERHRLGRLVVMLTRAGLDGMGPLIGLGIDERTALCIEADGSGRLFGEGQASLVTVGDPEPAMLERPFGPQVAEVVVLGPASTVNLLTRAVANPVDRMTVFAHEGGIRARITGGGAPSPGADEAGGLVIAGGALRASNDAVIGEFVRRGKLETNGMLGVIPAASGRPVRSARAFMEALQARGIDPDRIRMIPLAVEDDSGTPDVDESEWRHNIGGEAVRRQIRESSAIWFTGGDQSRIMRIFGGEEAKGARKVLWELIRSGGVIGGTSAGAAVQSETMIVGGSSAGALRHGVFGQYGSMKDQERGPLTLGEGFGFFPHGIIDQHFDRKARLGRLVVALLKKKVTHGFGIDEDTALVYDFQTAEAHVTGPGTVVMVDVGEVEVDEGRVSGIRLSVLAEGDRLRWPGPEVRIHPEKSPTVGNEYLEIAQPQAMGVMDPYGGRIGDILGYLLADNSAAREVRSRICYPDGACRQLRFRMDERTAGYWAALDGEMDSYSVLEAILDIGPEEPSVPRSD